LAARLARPRFFSYEAEAARQRVMPAVTSRTRTRWLATCERAAAILRRMATFSATLAPKKPATKKARQSKPAIRLLFRKVRLSGLEPETNGLKVRCSTN
jgi:hypothetical protein